ncbi:methylated-DNA--[protein]-cysteine S-methyltransferase [Actinacidiphila paucisporea]|uniref:methylated-DNA--[protein]-cysteine S-methyltransferase n=1 Tax=Actinacidiphila paucisporea TaxID=310782 RepID=A0A1M7GVM9_9ACTN|nr:methylated-DNA--[protein]-cysteine S-methyltransferase [Actinacidiphila paucisporea]SHM20285.1 methylated-DNA-[protein]-cysteine S-methyltransferase [Actinacidiphila paucisporea]
MTVHTTIDSPIGPLLLVGEKSAAPGGPTALAWLTMAGQKNAPAIGADWVHDPAAFSEITRQLDAYFAGVLTRFDIPFADSGTGSEFRQRIWDALEAVPYGTITTYGEIARRVGVSRAEVRALGAAIGANPVSIVRPCHRVIGSDGSLKGYAGGLERKRELLTLEGALQPMLG